MRTRGGGAPPARAERKAHALPAFAGACRFGEVLRLVGFVGQGDGRKARVDLTGDEGRWEIASLALPNARNKRLMSPRRDSRTPSPKPAAPGAATRRSFGRALSLCRPFLCVCAQRL